jgi:hypothetical protein
MLRLGPQILAVVAVVLVKTPDFLALVALEL